MNVLEIYVTEGTSNGRPWTSRVAICKDHFKTKDGEGDFIKLYKCTADCSYPDSDVDVRPLFDERGRVADFREID